MKLELPLINEIKSILPIPNITIPSREQLKSIVTPHGDFPYHNIDHMIAVAKNSWILSSHYDINQVNRGLLFIAGLFHDAGRLDIIDHENILKAIEIFHNTMHFPASLEEKVNKYISATEYNKETTRRLQKEGSIEELILRDSDFLVWATNNERQEEMFQELSLEDGKNITKASTIRFLRKTGVFLPESKIMLEEAGFTKIPIKKSNIIKELLDKKDNNE